MAKSSSVNKVARAAATSAPKASRPGDRPLFFPLGMAAVVLIGSLFVFLAWQERNEGIPDERPTLDDRWFSAYSINICGEPQDPIAADTNIELGIHTRGDGLIHIAPEVEAVTGINATVGAFFLESEGIISDSRMQIGDIDVDEAETLCDGEESELLILKWVRADTERPLIISDSLGAVRFDQNDPEEGQLFTFALVAKDADLDVDALKPDTTLLDDYIDGDPPELEPIVPDESTEQPDSDSEG